MRHQDRKKISDILVSSGWVRSGRGRSNFERRNRWRRNGYTVYISDLRQVKIETDGKTYERQTVAFVGPYSGIGWTQKTADEINCVVDSLPNFKKSNGDSMILLIALLACVETPAPAPAPHPVAARFTNGYSVEELQTQHKRAWGTDIPQGKSIVITHCFQEMKTTIKSGYGKTARETPVYGDLCDYDEDVFVPVNQVVIQGTGVNGIDEFPIAPSPDGNQRITPFSKYTIVFSDKSVIHPDKAEYIRQAGKL